MKRQLLDWLRCPGCQGWLSLSASSEEDGEVLEGVLECECELRFPVMKGIPRFALGEQYAESLGYQWKRQPFTQFDRDGQNETERTFLEKTGISPDQLSGRLVLDVGCGAGRFLETVGRFGAEVVGVDLSTSVEAAQENTGFSSKVHVVQADLFTLPFAHETFDYVFSIGVLHHTPDCEKAFKQLPPLLKTGGELAVWVYGDYSFGRRFSAFWRSISIRLPRRLLYFLCFFSIPWYYLKKIPLLGPLVGTILPSGDHPNWRWRVLDTFDWYSPVYQSKHRYPEVCQWFREMGLDELDILEPPVAIRGRK